MMILQGFDKALFSFCSFARKLAACSKQIIFKSILYTIPKYKMNNGWIFPMKTSMIVRQKFFWKHVSKYFSMYATSCAQVSEILYKFKAMNRAENTNPILVLLYSREVPREKNESKRKFMGLKFNNLLFVKILSLSSDAILAENWKEN